MPTIPAPDKPTEKGWDAVRRHVAQTEARIRARAMESAVRYKILRIREIASDVCPVFYMVAGLTPTKRHIEVCSLATFIHHSQAKAFIVEARRARTQKGHRNA